MTGNNYVQRENTVQHTSGHRRSQLILAPEYKLYVDDVVLQKMRAAADIADRDEIGGFGFVEEREVNGTNRLVVFDMMIPNQTVSGGGQDFSPMDAVDYRVEKGYPAESARFSWHTHGRGSPFWSPTDERWIDDMGQLGLPWVFSLVTDCWFREVEMRLDVFEPFRMVSQEVEFVRMVSADVYSEMSAIIDQKVNRGPLTIAAATRDLAAKGMKDIDVVWKQGPDGMHSVPHITGDIDLDRDDITEQQAAQLLADISQNDQITIRNEDEVAYLIKDEEDEAQDRVVAELEAESGGEVQRDSAMKVCVYCNALEGESGFDICAVSPGGEHQFEQIGGATRG